MSDPRHVSYPLRSKTMYQSQHFDCRILSTINIPAPIKIGLAKTYESWIRSNGPEWAIARMKVVKQNYIYLLSGRPLTFPWFKLGRDGLPAGHVGALFRFLKNNPKRLQHVVNLLNIYTCLLSKTPTDKQLSKFLSGVTASPGVISEQDMTMLDIASLMISREPVRETRPIFMRPTSNVRREPHASGKTFQEGEYTLDCAVSYLKQTKLGCEVRLKYPNLFKPVFGFVSSQDSRDYDYSHTVVWEYPNAVGKIAYLQEPGYKLRAVANPARVYQEALRPLGKALYKIVERLPWDCTHDQLMSVTQVQQHLKHGGTVHSVDLTGATDYFPLDLQMVVLNNLFPGYDGVHLFETLSRANWLDSNGNFVRWTKGQPLGLYPSFAIFTLTHGLCLYALNGFEHKDKFFVLGDDVIILDNDLASSYYSFLQRNGCPVSESKSIVSQNLCEFAGKVITPDLLVNNPKWHNITEDNFVDMTFNFGQKLARCMEFKYRKALSTVWEIPVELGGLGFNPRGLTLSQRYELYWKTETDNSAYVMSYNRLLNSMMYQSSPPECKFRENTITGPKQGIDMIPISYVISYLPQLQNWYEVVGKNLHSVAPKLYDLQIASKPQNSSLLKRLLRNKP